MIDTLPVMGHGLVTFEALKRASQMCGGTCPSACFIFAESHAVHGAHVISEPKARRCFAAAADRTQVEVAVKPGVTLYKQFVELKDVKLVLLNHAPVHTVLVSSNFLAAYLTLEMIIAMKQFIQIKKNQDS
jgi:hypothetical protein